MNYKFRSGSKGGLWCSLLLPFCLLPYAVKTTAGGYRISYSISICLVISYFIKRVIYGDRTTVSRYVHFVFYGLLSVPASTIIWCFVPYSLDQLFFISYASILIYEWLISTLLSSCPGSFSLGEVQIVAQSIILFLLSCCHSLLRKSTMSMSSNILSEKPSLNSVRFLQMLLFGCILLLYLLYIFPYLQGGLRLYLAGISTAIPLLVILKINLNYNPLMWLLEFCVANKIRIQLLWFWIASTFACVAFVMWVNQRPQHMGSTFTRKYFHSIINAVYIPGIMCDSEFLNLASGVALCILIGLETLRVLKIPPIGTSIQKSFQIFLDGKDSGVLILTHLYLLIGCSCPLWLYSYNLKERGFHICLLSGIISVGFGDAAAASGGVLFGRHRWKGTNKTVEGTVCAIIAQLLCSLPLLYYGHKLTPCNIFIIVTAVLLTSLLEARTSQVDNLILPLFMFAFLSWIP